MEPRRPPSRPRIRHAAFVHMHAGGRGRVDPDWSYPRPEVQVKTVMPGYAGRLGQNLFCPQFVIFSGLEANTCTRPEFF